MKILRIEFENLTRFKDGKFSIDFIATDRVFSDSELYHITRNIRINNILALAGLNATGKTTVLRLLRMAMQVVINNAELNAIMFSGDIVQEGTIMRVVFFHNNAFHQLESIIGVKETGYAYYKDETLMTKHKSNVRSKRDLVNFSDNIAKVVTRSSLDTAVRSYLRDSISIVISLTKDNSNVVADFLDLNHVNLFATVGKTPHEVLEVFDEDIDMLSAELNGNMMHYKVRFKGAEKTYDTIDMLALNQIVSAGTIKGQGLVGVAITVLQRGGYLLVDELEAHLNKKLVQVIIDLFHDERTNPHGACIVFSTHYAEILDFISRKDNIYITKKSQRTLSVSKYADDFKRNDFKKSEVFFSNALKGTAPSYEKIKRMREAICAALH